LSEQFGSLIPIWQWPPVLVAIFIFGIDFGAIMAIRVFAEGECYLGRFWSFKIGDTIGLPVLAGFAAVVVSEGHFSGFYTQLWWHLLILCLGYLISLGVQVKNLSTGKFTWEEVKKPSELWHTAVFGVMFYLVATVLAATIADHDPFWAMVGSFAGLGIWIIGVAADLSPWADKRPGRR